MKLLDFEKKWLLLIFETILPSHAHDQLPIGIKDIPIERFLNDLFSAGPFKLLLGVRLATWVLNWLPCVSKGGRTFSKLSQHERILWLKQLQQHPSYTLRELPSLMKMVACLGYCGLPDIQSQIGIKHIDTEPPDWAKGS